MTMTLDAVKRIVRDGISLNQATLAAMVPELVDEIEALKEELRFAKEAAGLSS